MELTRIGHRCIPQRIHSVGGKHKPFIVEVLQCHTESMEATPERDQTPEDQDETAAQPTIITLIPVAQEEIPTMPEMSQPNETNNNTIVTNAVVINNDGSAKVVGKGKDVYFFFLASTLFGSHSSSTSKTLDTERKRISAWWFI